MNYQRKRKVTINCADGTQKILYEPYNDTPTAYVSQSDHTVDISNLAESIHPTLTLPSQHQQILRASRGQSSKKVHKDYRSSAPYPYPSAAPLTKHPMPTPQPLPLPHPYSRPHLGPKDRVSAHGNYNSIDQSKIHVDGILKWKCKKCTYLNSIQDVKCKICLEGDCSDEATEFLHEKSWSCPCCTFLNSSNELTCTMCNEGKQFPTQLKNTSADIEVKKPEMEKSLPLPDSPKRTATKKLSITTKLTMDLIDPSRIYFITTSAAELKAEWDQVFNFPLCDTEKEVYLGQQIKCISVNAENKTAKVRFDQSQKPFLIPVGALYKSFNTEVQTDIRNSRSESTELFLIDEDYAKEVIFSDDSILNMEDDYDFGKYVVDIELSSDSEDGIFDKKKVTSNQKLKKKIKSSKKFL